MAPLSTFFATQQWGKLPNVQPQPKVKSIYWEIFGPGCSIEMFKGTKKEAFKHAAFLHGELQPFKRVYIEGGEITSSLVLYRAKTQLGYTVQVRAW